MPVKIGDIVAKLPHVAVVAPVYIQISTGSGHLQNIYGIDLHSYEGLHPFQYLSGGPFQSPDDVIVDDIYANGNHVKVGQQVNLLNQNFRVAGIVAHGQGARIFLQLEKLQELMLTPDNIPMLSTFIRIVIGIAVTIGFIVIFQAMYAAVMERTREIGILKSLGASKFYIVNAILRETTVLSVGGIVVGFLISFAARVAIQSRTTLPVDITSGWILRAIGIAIVGSLLGAIYPAMKAAQKDPIDALAYE